ncbi:hypothetical protein GH741_18460 [Aquibacillus halophilus]|uniref:Uncharacterized protein n=1 Tax=Aquibacillus halophilus TaxID=930132 RepID=A0A6A8DG54_9BACI|nr:hypothetical protein [Aquibacillus halophilus]MRH44633.1 hypothetical protein [Aquibacillus halophilus]
MNTFPIAINKKNIDLKPNKLAIYKQSKIIEAIDSDQKHYYLLFYKDKFLNGVQDDSIKIDSHIHRSFSQGIVFDGDHPITNELIRFNQPFSFTRFNQLYKKVEQHYSLIETVMIFTFFNSFIQESEIKRMLNKVYYQYRRNGQMLGAYQSLKIFQQFDGNYPFVTDMLNNMQFQKYEIMYQDLDQLITKDPIYVELLSYNYLDQVEYLQILVNLYQKQSRWMDELAIRIHLLVKEFAEKNFDRINEIIQQQFDSYNQTVILNEIVNKNETNPKFKQLLLDNLIQLEQHNDIVKYILTTDVQPQPNQISAILLNFQQADTEIFTPLFDRLNTRLIELFKHDHRALELTTIRCISSFFGEYDLNQIHKWFKPFHDADIHLPIENKLTKMQSLEEDPDQQFALGEIYLEFQQFEKSADCFKWEMELRPNDPRPVQFLSRIYKELGNKDEANAYQQLLIQMQKQ